MTTPADLAANEARIARRKARLEGIRAGAAVDPAPTTPAHVHRLRHDAAAAVIDREAERAEREERESRRTPKTERETPTPKPRRASRARPKASS